MHTNMYMYAFKYIHMQADINWHTCMYVCPEMHILDTHIYVYIHICMDAYMYVCTDAYMYIGKHVYMYEHTYVHYIHACKNTCACINACHTRKLKKSKGTPFQKYLFLEYCGKTSTIDRIWHNSAVTRSHVYKWCPWWCHKHVNCVNSC